MINWAQTAMIFPGQGSQEVGMGKDVAEAYPIAMETFKQADEIMGYALSDICFHGPEAVLNETHNTQPALYICSMAMLRALRTQMPDIKPAFLAGHSLGEFTALTVANAISFEDGVALVRERGRLMYQAGDENPGAMAAFLGLDVERVREICEQLSAETGGDLVVANDNCPGQVVVSGDENLVDRSLQMAQDAGARRALKLQVSVAAHSPLMAAASEQFKQLVDQTDIKPPTMPVYANVTAQPLESVDAIREELKQQVTQSVRWRESTMAMIEAGAETFIEIGSGEVLSGLVKRIDRKKTRITLNNLAAFNEFIRAHS